MASRRDDILNVAERLIRTHGYSGFSFREVASAVGIKSASVHYHFPAKPDLAAAVARRYRERFAQAVQDAERSGTARIVAWRALFLKALQRDGLMCLCGILAVEGDSLPRDVAREAHAFLRFGIDQIDEVSPGDGARVLSQLQGAMLLARSAQDVGLFERATENLAAA
ncbi:MAG: TetR/AcrR family transcriptional regulator [Pseudomonadota bacterium]